ncbi:hypothetical protein L7F22_054526 [Adiantum nelumboides]|nr:hypothetical protein [Adiantum nelumboides]
MADHLSRITNGEAPTGVDDDLPDTSLFMVDTIREWSEKIVNFLVNGFPPKELRKDVARRLIKECEPYSLIAGTLYKLEKDEILRRCAREDEYLYILQEAHMGVAGEHFSGELTTRKVLQSGYWWPTLFKDASLFAKGCDKSQRYKTTQRKDQMPLHPIKVTQSFQK